MINDFAQYRDFNDFAQYRDFNDFCQKNQLKPETALQLLMDTIDEMEKKIEVITK